MIIGLLVFTSCNKEDDNIKENSKGEITIIGKWKIESAKFLSGVDKSELKLEKEPECDSTLEYTEEKYINIMYGGKNCSETSKMELYYELIDKIIYYKYKKSDKINKEGSLQVKIIKLTENELILEEFESDINDDGKTDYSIYNLKRIK